MTVTCCKLTMDHTRREHFLYKVKVLLSSLMHHKEIKSGIDPD